MAGGNGFIRASSDKARVKWRRAATWEFAPKPDSQSILTFYMGKNTPERRDYIMEHLIVPVED
jgi:hypothetical protein